MDVPDGLAKASCDTSPDNGDRHVPTSLPYQCIEKQGKYALLCYSNKLGIMNLE